MTSICEVTARHQCPWRRYGADAQPVLVTQSAKNFLRDGVAPLDASTSYTVAILGESHSGLSELEPGNALLPYLPVVIDGHVRKDLLTIDVPNIVKREVDRDAVDRPVVTSRNAIGIDHFGCTCCSMVFPRVPGGVLKLKITVSASHDDV